MRWAEPKRAERAAEKAVRAYNGAASRLIDLARQAVVYDAPGALAAGLRAAARDPEVALVRVKNRLRRGYDAAATAGYRDAPPPLRRHARCRRCGPRVRGVRNVGWGR